MILNSISLRYSQSNIPKITTSRTHVLKKDSSFYNANSITRVSNKQLYSNPTGPQTSLRSFLGQISFTLNIKLWLNFQPRSQITRLKTIHWHASKKKKNIDMFLKRRNAVFIIVLHLLSIAWVIFSNFRNIHFKIPALV